MMSKCETKSVMSAVFETREQLDAAHKLAKHFGLWWAHSLREDEIDNLVGMTADEIKALCDHAVERDIADGCDARNWRVDPRPDYRTGAYSSGRTRWTVFPDGLVAIYIYRPTDISVLVGAWAPWGLLQARSFDQSKTHYRHVAALIHALTALTKDPAQQVWREIREQHPVLYARLAEEEREWEAHAALWKGRATVDPFQWRSSKEVAQ